MAVLNGHNISQVLPVAEAKQPVIPADIRRAWRAGHPVPALDPTRIWLRPVSLPCSWLGGGIRFAEGLGGLGQSVNEGLVPVHVRAAGAQFPGALLAQGFRHGRADQLSE